MRLRGAVVARMQPIAGEAFSPDEPLRVTLTLGCGHTVSATRKWYAQNRTALVECRRRHPAAKAG